jgi:hypothetical protein
VGCHGCPGLFSLHVNCESSQTPGSNLGATEAERGMSVAACFSHRERFFYAPSFHAAHASLLPLRNCPAMPHRSLAWELAFRCGQFEGPLCASPTSTISTISPQQLWMFSLPPNAISIRSNAPRRQPGRGAGYVSHPRPCRGSSSRQDPSAFGSVVSDRHENKPLSFFPQIATPAQSQS